MGAFGGPFFNPTDPKSGNAFGAKRKIKGMAKTPGCTGSCPLRSSLRADVSYFLCFSPKRDLFRVEQRKQKTSARRLPSLPLTSCLLYFARIQSALTPKSVKNTDTGKHRSLDSRHSHIMLVVPHSCKF